VDDEPSVCELVERYLSRDGYSCAKAFSGEEALNMLERGHYDLVITDIMMPGMSGLDLLNIIKTLFPDLAVLIITAVDDADTGVQAMESGAYGYIIKPFTRNQIRINVAGALERRRANMSQRREDSETLVRVRHDTGEGRKVVIPAKEIVKCIDSGMDDATLTGKFRISSEQLYGLFDRLVATGKLKPEDLEARSSLSPGSVAIDMPVMKLPETQAAKPVIKASDAVICIRCGMDDAALMKRYNISAKGLQSLLRKLIGAGLITEAEMKDRSLKQSEPVVLDEH